MFNSLVSAFSSAGSEHFKYILFSENLSIIATHDPTVDIPQHIVARTVLNVLFSPLSSATTSR